ncbi:GNAT family N-acetyltransferase [Clostridium saccharobutylicum]|nr:GNAT family N-acetyltransferase [Clostridium saccharobutylicum]MBC2411233.1 GNAT family N-acetyltransferase [Clostridium saccharobutylicum]MBC2435126.1 GNAT family N-acetyltransferase [Clostridium saccharobutylicum]MBC2440202.1 GNAT family N-acetyltransferase [Clostridium saccharobutylicum]MBC2443130.1 GNAT family N-acetyltransferase [Clostridium saccharobutylicum]
MTIKQYNSLCEEAKHIRMEVFVKEQGFKDEFDEWDNKVSHVVLFVDGKAAGTGRLLPGKSNKIFIIGRVAVLKKYRKLHLGSKIISALEEMAKTLGGISIELSAQCTAQRFYEKLGYVASGEIYLDEFCKHIHMEKQLYGKEINHVI